MTDLILVGRTSTHKMGTPSPPDQKEGQFDEIGDFVDGFMIVSCARKDVVVAGTSIAFPGTPGLIERAFTPAGFPND